MNAPQPFTPCFTDPLHIPPVTAQVRQLSALTEILLTTHRPWTAAERALVEAADAEAENDPFWGMVYLDWRVL